MIGVMNSGKSIAKVWDQMYYPQQTLFFPGWWGFMWGASWSRDIRSFHLFCIILPSLPFLPRSLKITEDKEGSDRTTSAAPPHLEAVTAREG